MRSPPLLNPALTGRGSCLASVLRPSEGWGLDSAMPLARQELIRCPFFADKILQIQLSQVLELKELKTKVFLWISTHVRILQFHGGMGYKSFLPRNHRFLGRKPKVSRQETFAYKPQVAKRYMLYGWSGIGE